ncbi:MAG TPA: Fe-S cluster assembly protein SufD [Stellaceae bacterium]|nr:Fe-S cluster assembly protein SufD [Stellaceae bacterium]
MSAVVDFPSKPEARPYLDAFRRPAGEPDWLLQARERSLARFAELGFPNRRGEAWRYLDLGALAERPILPSAAGRVLARRPGAALVAERSFAPAEWRLVLVDGHFAPELSAVESLPTGVWFGSTKAAVAERPGLVREVLEKPHGSEPEAADAARAFSILNTAFFTNGFVLDVAPGVALDRPIEILHLTAADAGAAYHTRSLVSLAAGARAELVETFAGAGRYWRNDVVIVRLGEGAELARTVLVDEAEEAVHFGETAGCLEMASHLADFVLVLGGGTVRREHSIETVGARTHSSLNGAYLVSGRNQANIVTTIDHRAPGGETRELVKGVAAGRGHGAFQGRITVRPGAQQVDAHQMSRNLLLGRRAVVDTKPELEIFADDVKCSHGAAVGDLDTAALFYLESRGIPRDEARRLLIEAFLREAVELLQSPALRDHLMARLGRRLAELEE